jgi:hypothetical protein
MSLTDATSSETSGGMSLTGATSLGAGGAMALAGVGGGAAPLIGAYGMGQLAYYYAPPLLGGLMDAGITIGNYLYDAADYLGVGAFLGGAADLGATIAHEAMDPETHKITPQTTAVLNTVGLPTTGGLGAAVVPAGNAVFQGMKKYWAGEGRRFGRGDVDEAASAFALAAMINGALHADTAAAGALGARALNEYAQTLGEPDSWQAQMIERGTGFNPVTQGRQLSQYLTNMVTGMPG